jgi:hypothetical protein
VQLDLAGLPKELQGRHGSGLLQLFYCVRSDCQGQGGWEPFADDLSRVRIVQGSGAAGPAPKGVEIFPAFRIVGWKSFDDYPHPGEHEGLGLRRTYDFKAKTVRVVCASPSLDVVSSEMDGLAEAIANAQPKDKLSGWPAWVQGVEYPSCPRCEKTMQLVLQLDSEDHVPFMWGDAGCAHITQCAEHKDVVAFGWACG